MHMGEFRTEPVGGVSCGGAGGDAFDIQIVIAPIEDLDHARATLGLRFAKPLQAPAFTLKEPLRGKGPTLAVHCFAHVISLHTDRTAV